MPTATTTDKEPPAAMPAASRKILGAWAHPKECRSEIVRHSKPLKKGSPDAR
jgi:hypothetical protein